MAKASLLLIAGRPRVFNWIIGSVIIALISGAFGWGMKKYLEIRRRRLEVKKKELEVKLKREETQKETEKRLSEAEREMQNADDKTLRDILSGGRNKWM